MGGPRLAERLSRLEAAARFWPASFKARAMSPSQPSIRPQHDQGVKQAGSAEMDFEIGDDASEDHQGPAASQQPTDIALPS